MKGAMMTEEKLRTAVREYQGEHLRKESDSIGEKSLPADDAVSLRRKYIEEETGADLSAVGTYTIPIDRVVTRNIENMIGQSFHVISTNLLFC